jgi:NAD(P)-dependent dehydrogenase (short-subunit alcohol dehydrogenase family)
MFKTLVNDWLANRFDGRIFLIVFCVLTLPIAPQLSGCVVLAYVLTILAGHALHSQIPIHKDDAVLITGASSGIGRAAALRFADRGIRVLACVRTQEDAEQLVSSTCYSCRIQPVILEDITDEQAIRNAVQQVQDALTQHGSRLVGIVNNASIGGFAFLECATPGFIQRHFEVNVFAQIRVTQAFLPVMRKFSVHSKERSARVVFVSSGSVETCPQFQGIYSATKAALDALAATWHRELKCFNIDVISLKVGLTQDTDFYKDALYKSTELLRMASRISFCEGSVFKKYEVSSYSNAGSTKLSLDLTKGLKMDNNGRIIFSESTKKEGDSASSMLPPNEPSDVAEVLIQTLCDAKPMRTYSVGVKVWLRESFSTILPGKWIDLYL